MSNRMTKSFIVKGDPKDVYKLWTEIEKFPEFISNVVSVTRTGDNSSRWVIRSPDGHEIRWEARLTQDDENARIAWNTIQGDLKISGQVTFQALPKDETQITVIMEYVLSDQTPGIEKIHMLDPGQVVSNALRDFKRYAESQYATARKPGE